jgi:hypothetical protein
MLAAALVVANIVLFVFVLPVYYGAASEPENGPPAAQLANDLEKHAEDQLETDEDVNSEDDFDEFDDVVSAETGSHSSYNKTFRSETVSIPIGGFGELEYKAHMN